MVKQGIKNKCNFREGQNMSNRCVVWNKNSIRLVSLLPICNNVFNTKVSSTQFFVKVCLRGQNPPQQNRPTAWQPRVETVEVWAVLVRGILRHSGEPHRVLSLTVPNQHLYGHLLPQQAREGTGRGQLCRQQQPSFGFVPPVLEPDLHLRLGECQRRGQVDALRAGQVLLHPEAPLQLVHLRVGEGRPGALLATGPGLRILGLEFEPVAASTVVVWLIVVLWTVQSFFFTLCVVGDAEGHVVIQRTSDPVRKTSETCRNPLFVLCPWKYFFRQRRVL